MRAGSDPRERADRDPHSLRRHRRGRRSAMTASDAAGQCTRQDAKSQRRLEHDRLTVDARQTTAPQ